MTTLAPVRLVHHELTPRQLDTALDAAGWSTWTARDGARKACPLALVSVPRLARAYARVRSVGLALTCLRVDPVVAGPGDWLELLVELTAVAPKEFTDLTRRGLVYEADVQGEGTARYLLGIGVAA